jgi:hypothetical protein
LPYPMLSRFIISAVANDRGFRLLLSTVHAVQWLLDCCCCLLFLRSEDSPKAFYGFRGLPSGRARIDWLLFRFLAKCEAERDKTSTFVDSIITVHLFVQEVTSLAVVVIDIFTKVSRPSREEWVHIQHYFQGVPPRPVTFLK